MTIRLYTENVAAQLLEVPRQTLALRRKRGLVRPDVFVRIDRPQTERARTYYNADLIDEVAAGDASLYHTAE